MKLHIHFNLPLYLTNLFLEFNELSWLPRKWPKNDEEGQQSISGLPSVPGEHIGIQGEILARAQLATGACTKCGYVGHLPFSMP
ncbi:hypothetical protein Mgra_00007933 [Meloidogyne graminicola]|uniref:Uncharacterized protein n=1 Tax=Meloidogyne graminicola TaxID=189291 RepID=A0A8S9ZH76_9BILA|nr:hypothetical protein Mgra_00007933 [Meloidogyne graminicola]